jgi:twinkle protein
MSDREGGLGSIEVATKLPCPECGKERLNKYADGHSHCFNVSCGYHTPPDQQHREERVTVATPKGLLKPGDGAWAPLTKRNLTTETLRRFGYFQGGYKGKRVQVAPLYDQKGNLVAQELLTGPTESEVIGELGEDLQLFGMHAFGDRNDRKVVIHRDPRDAMSTAQATRITMPCVSVTGGSTGAAKSCKTNYRWLDRFQEIILFFGADSTWEKAAQEVATLFPVGKVKIARIPDAEGPSDALSKNRAGDIYNAVWAAVPWRPLGIINAADRRESFFEEGLQTPSWPYPWDVFNEKSVGMRPGECTYHVGGTGIAKTTLMIHYANHLVKWTGEEFIKGFPVQEPCKVGWFGFEDLTKQAMVAMLGIHAGKMLSLKPVSDKEGLRLFDELFGSRRLEMYDPEQAEYGLDAVFSYIRYMRQALDCKVIVLDPLTFLVSQLPAAHRTQEEDRLAGRLAAEAKAQGISFHIGYHLRKPDGTPFEEGAAIGLPDIKGSGALTHFAHNVIAYERDQQGDRPDLLRVRWLKNRVARFTGVGCILKYDMETGRYEPTDEPWPGDESDAGSSRNFPPAPETGGDY